VNGDSISVEYAGQTVKAIRYQTEHLYRIGADIVVNGVTIGIERPFLRVQSRKRTIKRGGVVKHWRPKLAAMGKTFEVDHDVCFACGTRGSMERAHILPHVLGGSCEPENIHLLCPKCHDESESLHGEDYFLWFVAGRAPKEVEVRLNAQQMMARIRQLEAEVERLKMTP
jgi:5-methylcytosine-specific restriction endonuclease McrA